MDSTNEKNGAARGAEAQARRTFLKRVGKATATAPAVALLMSASVKAATPVSSYAPDCQVDPNSCCI